MWTQKFLYSLIRVQSCREKGTVEKIRRGSCGRLSTEPTNEVALILRSSASDWRPKNMFQRKVAEGVGFEPTLRFPVNTLSKRAPSATRPPLLIGTSQRPRLLHQSARRALL